MRLPSPIPYQGSKRQIAQDIIACFPAKVDRLVEPFAGSAAVTIAAACLRKAKRFWINDVNEPLMNLWTEIIYHPERIAQRYGELWENQLGRKRQYYDEVRDKFNITRRPEYLLYLLSRCVKASVRYNGRGRFNQSPDNRRKGMRPDRKAQHIRRVSALLRGRTRITAWDYREVLQEVKASDLVYMDPPYQGVVKKRDPRYERGVTFQEFVESLRNLRERDIRFIVSYDGRTGNRTHGKELPRSLGLARLEVNAGASSQATLLGKNETTVESLYLSPSLLREVGLSRLSQRALFEEPNEPNVA